MPSSALAYFSADICCEHEMGPHHPESPMRLMAITKAIRDAKRFDIIATTASPWAPIKRVHKADHIRLCQSPVGPDGHKQLDPDTSINPSSLSAALHAAGSACQAIDAVMGGQYQHGFCGIRPPGHHAEPDRVMGFCLFNSIAIAAHYAHDHYGLQRVAIVDFDVHHGNGTQQACAAWDWCRFFSSHQSPLYPYSGFANEVGTLGNIANFELPASSDGSVMRDIYRQHVLADLHQWQPEILLVSAGFDAHKADPLAGLNWHEGDYFWLGQQLGQLADICGAPMVSCLEGGYDVDALVQSVDAYMDGWAKRLKKSP